MINNKRAGFNAYVVSHPVHVVGHLKRGNFFFVLLVNYFYYILIQNQTFFSVFNFISNYFLSFNPFQIFFQNFKKNIGNACLEHLGNGLEDLEEWEI
jgi:hypothetical protein